MPAKARAPSSALRPSQASAAELVAGGCQIAIPAKQPLGELTQAPVAEYALSASPVQIDSEEASLLEWAANNHRIFPSEEIAGFEQQAGPQGGGYRQGKKGTQETQVINALLKHRHPKHPLL